MKAIDSKNEAPLLLLYSNSRTFFPLVNVFKTNVSEKYQAQKLIALLLTYDTYAKVNFDLEDCDKILRVESKKLRPAKIIQILNAEGFECVEGAKNKFVLNN